MASASVVWGVTPDSCPKTAPSSRVAGLPSFSPIRAWGLPRSHEHAGGGTGEFSGSRTSQYRAKNSRRYGDPPLDREAAYEGDDPPRHRRPARAASGDLRRRRRDGQGPIQTSDQDGPEPGHLRRRRARSEREAGRALGRRANGTEASARTAEIREGTPAPDGPRRVRPTTEEDC